MTTAQDINISIDSKPPQRKRKCCTTTRSVSSKLQCTPAKKTATRGFWSPSKLEISRKLWWPDKTDWHASTAEHAASMKIQCFAVPDRQLLQSSWQSSTFTLVGRTEQESTGALSKSERTERSRLYENKSEEEVRVLRAGLNAEKIPKVMRSRLVKLKLTARQLAWMQRWFKDADATYNMVIQEILSQKLHLRDWLSQLAALKVKFRRAVGG